MPLRPPVPRELATLSLVLALAFNGAGRSAGTPAVSTQDCGADASLSFLCGPVAAEDVAVLPGERWAIASALNVGAPARLHALDLATRRAVPIDIVLRLGRTPLTPDCIQPPDPERWSTDGLALVPGGHGGQRLYAANHGDRHAVEILDIEGGAPRSAGPPRLQWRGCLRLPAGHLANALAGLPDGGLLVASFHDPDDPRAWDRMARGEDTGAILEWQAASGWRTLARMPGGNGIATSADGETVYASAWAIGQIIVLSRRSGLRTELPLGFLPDNLHRMADGSLLVAGQASTVKAVGACAGPQCPQPWRVVRLDPTTGRQALLLQGPGTPQLNYACGARPAGGRLIVTFRGKAAVGLTPAPGLH